MVGADLNPIAVLRMRYVADQDRAGGLGTDLLLAVEAYYTARLGVALERAVELAERALKPGRLAAAGRPGDRLAQKEEPEMRPVYIAILIAAMLALAVGGWIVEGARKIVSPRPRLTPRVA